MESFCPYCGSKISPGASFCSKCGANVQETVKDDIKSVDEIDAVVKRYIAKTLDVEAEDVHVQDTELSKGVYESSGYAAVEDSSRKSLVKQLWSVQLNAENGKIIGKRLKERGDDAIPLSAKKQRPKHKDAPKGWFEKHFVEH